MPRSIRSTAAAGLAATLATGGLALGLGSAPAWSADASVQVTPASMVRYSKECSTQPVAFRAIGSDPNPGEWSLAVSLWKKGATSATTHTTYNYQGNAVAVERTLSLRVCGSDFAPGSYSMEYRFAHGAGLSRLIAGSSTFTVRAPRARTRLTTTALGGGKHRAKVRVAVQTPKGYKATRGVPVRLQHQTTSGWKLLKGTRARTRADGTVLITFTSPTPRKAVQVRAATSRAPFRAASTSAARTIGG